MCFASLIETTRPEIQTAAITLTSADFILELQDDCNLSRQKQVDCDPRLVDGSEHRTFRFGPREGSP
jgi:hypothetical protein